jgi:hypothetical protein
VTAVSAGTATIAVATVYGNRTDECTVTVTPQGVTVEPNPPTGEQPGHIVLGLELPADADFSGTFYVVLPYGLNLDLANTALLEPLASLYDLSVTAVSSSTWLFTITPKTLRAAGATYQKVVKIAYTADETAPEGEYEVKIRDLEFTFANNTVISHDEISVTVTTRNGAGVGVEAIASRQAQATVANGVLVITSPASEQVYVYSASGALLYSANKAPGEANCHISHLPKGVLIVAGSSGWTQKVILK